MTAFPPGAPSFQLPRPYRGVVFFDDGNLVCLVDGVRVLTFPISPPAPPAANPPQPFDRRLTMFTSLLKAAVGVVVETPLAVVADAVTLGGVLTDKSQPYTVTALEKVVENVQDATK